MTDLSELAQRCIDAPGRETDAAIALSMPDRFFDAGLDYCGRQIVGRIEANGRRSWPGDGQDPLMIVPPFTTSIDAAMTLIPEGWSYTVCWMHRKNRAAATLFHAKLPECRADADTLAQAICAAALIARIEHD